MPMKHGLRIFSALLSLAVIFAAAVSPAYASADVSGTKITRLSGADRLATSYAIADAVSRYAGSADPSGGASEGIYAVFIADGFNYPDALAGSALAAYLKAPVCLIGKSDNSALYRELEKLSPKKVYILGGVNAVASSVETRLKGTYETVRIAGSSRYETAVEIARRMPSGDSAFLVNGENYPDALSISPVAGIMNAPLLFSGKSGAITSETLDCLKNSGIKKVFIIGGGSAVGTKADAKLRASGFEVERVYGGSRYATSAEVCRRFSGILSPAEVSFACGTNFPDALTGSVYSALCGLPVLLIDNKGTNEHLRGLLSSRTVSRAVVYGGENAVSSDAVKKALGAGGASSYASTTTTTTTTTTAVTTTTAAATTTTTTTATTALPDDPALSGKHVVPALNAPAYIEKNVSSSITGYLKAGTSYIYTETTSGTDPVVWYSIAFDDGAAGWARAQDMFGTPITAEKDAAVYSSASKTSSRSGSVNKDNVYYYSKTEGSGDDLWYFLSFEDGSGGWVFRPDIASSQPEADSVEAYIADIAGRYGAVGIQVAVIDGGRVTGTYDYGWATKKSDEMTSDTKIRLASLSKVAVAIGTMKMQEQGVVDINADISRYWNAKLPKPVTLKSLLTHSSTLKHLNYKTSKAETIKQIIDPDSYEKGSVGDGSTWYYNNYAVGIAGSTLELASGKPLNNYAKQNIFGPLGMDASFMSGDVKDTGKLATLYYSSGNVARSAAASKKITSSSIPGNNTTYFAGGLTCSAKDYAKLVAMLANNGEYDGKTILSSESVDAIEHISFNAHDNYGGNFGQAMPLRFNADYMGQSKVYYHTGSSYGVLALASYNPDTRDGVVVVTTGAADDRDGKGVYCVCSYISEYIYRNVL